MDREAWQAPVHRVAESDTAEGNEHAHVVIYLVFSYNVSLKM